MPAANGQWPSVAPARSEEQLSAFTAPAVAHDEERVAEEAECELAPAAPVQPRGRQPLALASVEQPPHVVERHELELEDSRRPQYGVTGLDSTEQLAASHEARVVEAAERAVPAHGGEGAVARFHRELGRERRAAAPSLAGETRGEGEPLPRGHQDAGVCRGARVAGPARGQGLEGHATVPVDLLGAG